MDYIKSMAIAIYKADTKIVRAFGIKTKSNKIPKVYFYIAKRIYKGQGRRCLK